METMRKFTAGKAKKGLILVDPSDALFTYTMTTGKLILTGGAEGYIMKQECKFFNKPYNCTRTKNVLEKGYLIKTL